MEDWRRHFDQFHKLTQYDLFRIRVSEGVGYSQAYRDVYGELPCNTPREFAEYLHDRGYSIRDISIWVKLRFGVGSKSVVHRWLSRKAYEKHLEQKRKKRKP